MQITVNVPLWQHLVWYLLLFMAWASLWRLIPVSMQADFGLGAFDHFIVVVLVALPLLLQIFCRVRQPRNMPLLLTLGSELCIVEEGTERFRAHVPRVRFLGEWLIVLQLLPVRGSEKSKQSNKSRNSRREGSLAWLRRRAGSRTLLIVPGSCSRNDEWQLRRYLRALQHEA